MDSEKEINNKRFELKTRVVNMINNDENSAKKLESDALNVESELADEVAKKWNLNEKILELFQTKLNIEILLKKKYAIILIGVLIVELLILNVSFIFQGLEIFKVSDIIFNIFISGGLVEIYVLIKVIVNYLFKDDLSELLKVILSNENGE